MSSDLSMRSIASSLRWHAARLLLAFVFVGLSTSGFVSAQQPASNGGQQYIPNNMIVNATKTQGSSNKRFRDQAVRAIPMQQLSREHQAKVNEVLNKTAVYRRLPTTTIHTDPDLYLFMIRYPETMLNIWQIMGVTQMTASRVAPFRLNFNDGVGTDGHVELIYGTPHVNIYYGEGIYEGPMLFRRVEGQCLLVLQTQYHRDAEGNPQTTSSLDVFLRIDHLAAGIIAKTVHPLIGTTADHNFVESLRFLQKLSETTQTNGNGVRGLSRRLNNVHPEVQQRFFKIIDLAASRSEGSQPRVVQQHSAGQQRSNPNGAYPGNRQNPSSNYSHRQQSQFPNRSTSFQQRQR